MEEGRGEGGAMEEGRGEGGPMEEGRERLWQEAGPWPARGGDLGFESLHTGRPE